MVASCARVSASKLGHGRLVPPSFLNLLSPPVGRRCSDFLPLVHQMMIGCKQVPTIRNIAIHADLINCFLVVVARMLRCSPLLVVAACSPVPAIALVPPAIHLLKTISCEEHLVPSCIALLSCIPPEPPVVLPSGCSSWLPLCCTLELYWQPSVLLCVKPDSVHFLTIQSAPKYHVWSCQCVPLRLKNVLEMANCA